jgi:hypothetical protein
VVTEISEDCWRVSDRVRGIERTFATPRAAVHYALFEAVQRSDRACALIVPRRSRDAY